MDALKALMLKYLTPYLAKIMLRIVGYGVTALAVKLGIDQASVPDATWQAGTASFLTATVVGLATLALDYWQHKQSTPADVVKIASLNAQVKNLRSIRR